jgi:hypothetical protein
VVGLSNNLIIFLFFQPSLANNGRLASTLAIVSGLFSFFKFCLIIIAYTLGESPPKIVWLGCIRYLVVYMFQMV